MCLQKLVFRKTTGRELGEFPKFHELWPAELRKWDFCRPVSSSSEELWPFSACKNRYFAKLQAEKSLRSPSFSSYGLQNHGNVIFAGQILRVLRCSGRLEPAKIDILQNCRLRSRCVPQVSRVVACRITEMGFLQARFHEF